MEEKLKISEECFRNLIEEAPIGFCLVDAAGKIQYVNKRIEEVSGRTREEFIGRDSFADGFFDEDMIAILRERLSIHLAGGFPPRIEVPMTIRNGERIWVEFITTVISQNGVPAGLQLAIMDVTARRRAQDALRESESKFRDLAEKSLAGIYLLQDGIFQYVNLRFAEIFGYNVEDMIGKIHVQDVIFAEDWPIVRENLDKRLAGDLDSLHYEFRICKKNQEIRNIEIYSSRTVYQERPAVIGTLLDITDRRQTEAVLRESEARLRQVIDLVPHFIFAKDRQGRFILVNQAVADNYGTTVEQLTGKTDGDFNPDREEVEHFLRDDLLVIDSGRPKEIPEEKITDAKGRTRILQTTKIPFTVSLTGNDAVLGVSTDITGYKQAQSALQKSEEKYRQIFENSVGGIFQTTPTGQLISANRSLARMAGYDSAKEVMEAVNHFGKPLYVYPEDRRRLTKLLEKHGAVEKFEVQVYRKDKAELWVSINAHTVFDESGQVAYFEGTVEDITKRRYFEQALKESEAKYRSVVESSLVGFYIVQDDLFRFVNRHFSDVTGYSYDEVVDRMSPMDIIHPDDKMNVSASVEKWLTGQENSIEYGFRVIKKDGRTIMVKVFGNTMIYQGRKVICGTFIDITREKAMEAQLHQAQKMEAIGTLAGGIAHDFNNILGAMIGYTELTKLKTDDDKINPYLEQILKACDRAKDLINQILTFSRQKTREKKALSVTPIAKEVLKLLRSSLPATIDVRIHFQNRHDTILADATQIHQVLINLCTNASHAMRGRGGILEITFSQQEITAEEINHDSELKRGLYLKIVISDTGHGIDSSIRDKIFDPFFTTKGPGEGTGLGLSVVYGIIKNHGGGISVSSEPGKGTTFTIYLPLIDIVAQQEKQNMNSVPVGKGHILLVDDEEPLASIGKEMLTSLGYDVTVRFSSLDALEAFRANPHRFNLLISDTTMPNMTGPHMAMEMLRIRPDLPIILTTGYSEIIDEEEAKKMGVQELIMKPVSFQHLAHAVKRVLDQAQNA